MYLGRDFFCWYGVDLLLCSWVDSFLSWDLKPLLFRYRIFCDLLGWSVNDR